LDLPNKPEFFRLVRILLANSPAFLAMARFSPQHQRQFAALLRPSAVERADARFDLRLKFDHIRGNPSLAVENCSPYVR